METSARRHPSVVLGLALALAGLLSVSRAQAGFDAIRARAQVPLLDSIEVLVRSREIIAIEGSLGSGIVAERLDRDEEVLWVSARGRVGVVITDRRVLAIASGSPRWQWTRLGVHESLPSLILLGDRVVLLVTDQRAIGFSSNGTRRLVVEDIGTNERVIDAIAGDSVAVLLTDRRVLGLHERLHDVSTLADFATVATHRRLLVFKAATANWEERGLSLR